MNISDVKIDLSQFKKENYVRILFEKQDQLRKLYGVPICDLDVPSDQQQLRAMAWNVIEEATEALDVLQTTQHSEHILDELADMTSFYVELFLMSSLTSKDFSQDIQESKLTVDESFTNFAVSLGLTINTLKNRYWRKTNLHTEQILYHERLRTTVPEFLRFIHSFGISFETLFESYLKKHEVNLFRIRSKY